MFEARELTPRSRFEVKTKSKRAVAVNLYGEVDYPLAQQAMANFASARDNQELDQIWLLQHPAVYTQGSACRQTTLLPSSIDIVKSDRGGQITYHGPGQVVMYPLLDLQRLGVGVKTLVSILEQAVIEMLAELNITGERRAEAPGVYVKQKKIAALGLRVRRGTCYHGLSLNVDMDISPFFNIHACGYEGLEATQLADHIRQPDADQIALKLLGYFVGLI